MDDMYQGLYPKWPCITGVSHVSQFNLVSYYPWHLRFTCRNWIKLHGPAEKKEKKTFFTWVSTRNGPRLSDPSNITGWTAFCSRVLFCNLPIKMELFPKAARVLVLYNLPHYLCVISLQSIYMLFISLHAQFLCSLSLCFFTTLFLSAHSLMGQNP